jgi:diguanylate cyclase
MRVVRTTARLSTRLIVALVLVAVTVAAGQFLVPAGGDRRTFADATAFVAGVIGAAACFAGALREGRAPIGRRWRLLLGAGLAAFALIRISWVVRDIVDPGRPAAASVGDVGVLILPACTFLALLTAARAMGRPSPASSVRDRIVLVIDSVLLAGSVAALVWTTVPASVRHELNAHPWPSRMAVAYVAADLILLMMVVLLLVTRPAPVTGPVPLRLAGLGIAAYGVSDAFRLLHLTDEVLPPAQAAGYLLGPALFALAALYPPDTRTDSSPAARRADWLHLALPYVPVVATGVVILLRTAAGGQITAVEVYLGWLALGLVVARQMVTIVDNTVLLDRVSEGQRRLHHQAYHDPLTGLANRALFRERLVAALAAHRDDGRPIALLFADLDDFKLINDSFGHAMGDRLLHEIAGRMRGPVPPDGVIARLGGDEFAVLLPLEAATAEAIGHQILRALREPFVIDGQTVGVGASIGLVVPEAAEADLSADTLVRRADAAMYASKRRGKGNVARYAGGSDGGPHADLPYLLARALTGAPADAGFEVYYQPIVRFADGVTVAVEALARWTDPEHGPVDPDVFVTVAERTGLVAAIDDFVLDRACADAAGLANTYGRPIDVHVNVSAARLGQAGLEESVVRSLERHAVRPSRLVLEITETRRIPDLGRAALVTARLRSYGVRIALDDFGSGYNALAQLHSLPVDIVKLDSSLTDVDIAPDRAGTLCRSVLSICADLRITVVAEGIETPARAHALASLGCPLGQGYLFGQPRPLGALIPPHLTVPGPRPAHLGHVYQSHER